MKKIDVYSEEDVVSCIAEMFNLQDSLNIVTAGEDYTKGYNHLGMALNYSRFAAYEFIEMANSYNFKTWKKLTSLDEFNMPNDLNNIKIELVDVWHFIMSSILVKRGYSSRAESISTDEIAGIFMNVVSRDTIDEKQQLRYIDLATINLLKLSAYYDKMSRVALKENSSFYLLPNKELLQTEIRKFESILSYPVAFKKLMKKTLKLFFKLVYLSFDDFSEFYKMYCYKCGLNLFRQYNGYADGSYVKEWNIEIEEGEIIHEDNEALFYYNGRIRKNDLLEYLDEKYKLVLDKAREQEKNGKE